MPVLKKLDTNGILLLTLSRPEALNALNQELLQELESHLQDAYHNREISGLIITGDGPKAFAAGADIRELAACNQAEAWELAQKGQQLFSFIERLHKPVVAAINGFALGGGCELAMSCHLRIASENAKFGQPELNLGIIPGYGGTQRLTQLVGRGKALELILTGDLVTADEAKAMGMVNHVLPDQVALMDAAYAIMNKIVQKSPLAVGKAIAAVNAGFGYEREGYETEARLFSDSVVTEDFKEGTTAFLEKRKPKFKGI